MITLWGLLLGLPVLFGGLAAVVSPEGAFRRVERFCVNRPAAVVLTVLAWFWTAWECHTIGIDVFDMILKRFPGEVWILAAVLSYLTVIWMPKNLPVRAVTALLMLFPAELFKTTRLLVPASGFAAVHVIVAFAYVAAVIGMYGMFYPWRIEKALSVVGRTCPRAFGAVLAVIGAAVLVSGFAAR